MIEVFSPEDNVMLRSLLWPPILLDSEPVWTPVPTGAALQMEETPTTLRLSLPVGSFHPEDIQVRIEGNCLRLQGYSQLRSPYGQRWQLAQQLLTLPCSVRADQYLTELEGDRLTLTLLKLQPQRSFNVRSPAIWESWKQAWKRGRQALGRQLQQWSDRLLQP